MYTCVGFAKKAVISGNQVFGLEIYFESLKCSIIIVDLVIILLYKCDTVPIRHGADTELGTLWFIPETCIDLSIMYKCVRPRIMFKYTSSVLVNVLSKLNQRPMSWLNVHRRTPCCSIHPEVWSRCWQGRAMFPLVRSARIHMRTLWCALIIRPPCYLPTRAIYIARDEPFRQ